MQRVSQILATTGEISLKGANRPWFEHTLTENVRSALADLPVDSIRRPSWRVLVTFSEEVDAAAAIRRLEAVFGLNSIMPVRFAGITMDDLRQAVVSLLPSLEADSFAVRCLRSDKRFRIASPDVEREIGTLVQERTGWPVNLKRPALTIHILIDEAGLYLWTRRVRGPGGLPVGVGGRALCLLSGGIDSPVAAWMMMKRGMRTDFVHFHSVPRTSPASLDKVRRLVEILNRYQRSTRLATVPLLTIQEQVVARCPAELRVLLYRRFMLRIADEIARGMRSHALVTGESLGQVASQTVENIAAVQPVARLPVLRPLIAYDKQEIIALARRIGSYPISIEPHQDCCSFLQPEYPATRSDAAELAAAEDALAVDTMVREAMDRTEIDGVRGPAPWDDETVPQPVGS
jgi:thiamine biosynthesis protein ThiI